MVWDSTLALQLDCISGLHFHTLSHSTVLPPCSRNLIDTVSPQKALGEKKKKRVSHWELIRLSFCLGLNSNPGSYQSNGSGSLLIGSCTSPGSIVHLRPSLWLARRLVRSGSSLILWIKLSFGTWQDHLSWRSSECTLATGEVKTTGSAIPEVSL
jgi:hypothetical protein